MTCSEDFEEDHRCCPQCDHRIMSFSVINSTLIRASPCGHVVPASEIRHGDCETADDR